MRYYGLTKIGGRVARRNGWFDSPIDTFAKELCSEGGTAKQYQDEFRAIASGADTKIKGLLEMPASPERDRLLAEFRKNKADSLRMVDYIYEAQQYGYDAGFDECERFFRGPIPFRNNARRNPAPLVPILWGSVAVLGLAVIYRILQEVRLTYGNNSKAYEDIVATQTRYAEDICERAKSDPSYREACEKAMEQLAKTAKDAPPPQQESPLAPFVPYIVLGFAVLVGYRVVVNRLSARDEPKRDESKEF